MDYTNNNYIKLQINNGQIIALFLFIITLFISLLLAYNEKLNLKDEEPIFDDKTVLIIAIINRSVVVILGLYFVYTSLIEKELDNRNNIQVITSILAFLASLIGLYDLIRNYQELNNNIDLPLL